MTDFNELIDFSKDIEINSLWQATHFKGVHMYEGPITFSNIFIWWEYKVSFYGNLIINVKKRLCLS